MSIIQYLNTDLDLKSHTSFNELNKFFNKSILHSLHYEKISDGEYFGVYETNTQFNTPLKTIKKFLDKFSKMDSTCKRQWNKCYLKEFNIGYDCGKEPWAFENEIPSDILKEIAKLKISLKITIYPEDKSNS